MDVSGPSPRNSAPESEGDGGTGPSVMHVTPGPAPLLSASASTPLVDNLLQEAFQWGDTGYVVIRTEPFAEDPRPPLEPPRFDGLYGLGSDNGPALDLLNDTAHRSCGFATGEEPVDSTGDALCHDQPVKEVTPVPPPKLEIHP